MNILKTVCYPIAIAATLSLSACSIFGVYKIDLPQGTPITQKQAQQIQPGMSKNQVLYLIGSPDVRDTLAPNRWDYIYDYTPGTYGEREGKKVINNASQHLIIYFDNSDIVTKVEGLESLPMTK
ncbi:outer membrane protein assembly factor BamE [Psychrobacter sp.]|uniref:outer membrane protein assembly factor BamE n=1 Tax=Psychrobacter sp. TaxID=56811 RepID=UPI0025DFC193|nr:outer membrane protein assembly factor BamE [Psychrobacter sp.]